MRSYLTKLGILTLLICVALGSCARAGSLSIQPLRQELELKPGQTLNSFVLVTNTGNSPTIVSMSAESFGVINENYDYSFDKAQDVKSWVHFDETSAVIKPHDDHSFNYSIGIPITAEPGEKYIAIFASVNSTSSDNVSVTDRVGELSYITIAGNVTRRGKVLGLTVPFITLSQQLSWDLRLENTGTAHFDSVITTNMTNAFDRTLSRKTEKHLILPATTRLLSNTVGLGSWPGLYHVKFLIGRGDDPASYVSRWVIYAPLWATIILVVALISVGEFFYRRHKKHRKYTIHS